MASMFQGSFEAVQFQDAISVHVKCVPSSSNKESNSVLLEGNRYGYFRALI